MLISSLHVWLILLSIRSWLSDFWHFHLAKRKTCLRKPDEHSCFACKPKTMLMFCPLVNFFFITSDKHYGDDFLRKSWGRDLQVWELCFCCLSRTSQIFIFQILWRYWWYSKASCAEERDPEIVCNSTVSTNSFWEGGKIVMIFGYMFFCLIN